MTKEKAKEIIHKTKMCYETFYTDLNEETENTSCMSFRFDDEIIRPCEGCKYNTNAKEIYEALKFLDMESEEEE